jgi:hypothetical protein
MEIPVHIGELRDYRETYSKYVVDCDIRGSPAVFVYACQTSTTGFFPEVDSYARLTSNVRLVLQAKGYMEEGDFMRAELGPSFQLNPRPSEKLRKLSVFDMDDMKPMPVVFSIGYRYLPSATGPSTNRLEPLVMLSYSNAGAHPRHRQEPRRPRLVQ